MTIQDFFVATIEDLKKKQSWETEYDTLRACGLLRQLLIDTPTLIAVANKPYKLKIDYLVFSPPLIDFGFPIIEIMDIETAHRNSDGTPGKDCIQVDVDRFLKARCLTIWEHNYTVYDVIISGAHVHGGVHSSYGALKHKDFFLIEMKGGMAQKEALLFTRTVSSICRVVIDATEKLVSRINKDRRTPTDGFEP